MLQSKIVCLGIESTAHTFSASVIVSNGSSPSAKNKILSNVIKGFTTKTGGMIPNQVAEHHVENCDAIISKALADAKMSISDVTLISYSQSPGIGNMLRVGAACARALAIRHNIPLVGVNHSIAHLEIGRLLTKAKDPILVYVSGANTQIIAYLGKRYRIFGETLDMGIGNFLDSFGRVAGLGFPGGPKIAALADEAVANGRVPNYIELPYVVKGMDMSFGGLLTNVTQKLESKKYDIRDLCFSIQETVFAMVSEISERALAHCGKREIVLGGGVACNKRLQQMIQIMCKARGAKAYFQENQYYVDNAAMIAWLGVLEYRAGISTPIAKATIDPYLRTDQIEVTWRK